MCNYSLYLYERGKWSTHYFEVAPLLSLRKQVKVVQDYIVDMVIM